MKKLKKLDWSSFDWESFEDLCREIAETEFPNMDFDGHLGKGSKQDGIDITGFNQDEKKFLCIQSKRNNAFGSSLLRDAIEKFLDGDYLDKTYHFIIATSKDLQKETSKKTIDDSKIFLAQKYNLRFDCWDQQFIEKKLTSRYGLVSKYFGVGMAKRFCNPETRFDNFIPIKPVDNYISRQLYKFEETSNKNEFRWYFNKRERFDLLDLITDKDYGRKFCIVGDPYEGKSSFLKEAALSIEKQVKTAGLQAIFAEIKNFNAEGIDSMLDKQCGDWQSVPSMKIVLFIDGLDEIEADKFLGLVIDLKTFCLHHPQVIVVCSCRKIFYTSFQLETELKDFSVYELAPIAESEIEDYLKRSLADQYDSFRSDVRYSNIYNFLHHPFYLTEIVSEYLTTGTLAASKVSVIDKLVDKSMNTAKGRRYKDGVKILENNILFKKLIQNFSLALQLSGLNAITEEEMQELFSMEERMLLRSNPLITLTNNSWSFINAMFQEHIAAKTLYYMPFSNIIAYATVGTKIRKIKKKWIQTLSSLISFCNVESPLFNELIELFKNDNIELLFETEPTQYTQDLKLSFLETLILECAKENRRLILVYEDKIGAFINDSVRCRQYVINCIKSADKPETVKIMACRILGFSSLTATQKDEYLGVARSEIARTFDAYYGGELVQVLARHKIGDKDVVEGLVNEFPHHNKAHEYRDNLYELITVLGLVDQYYQYGIDGVSILAEHNRTIRHGLSERRLQIFLLESSNPILLSRLLQFSESGNWKEFFDRISMSHSRKSFVNSLFEKLANGFLGSPEIIINIAEYIRKIGKRYLIDKHPEINNFLSNTDSYGLVSRLLVKDIFENNVWGLGAIVSPNVYDYFLFEFENNSYTSERLRNCVSGIRYNKECQEEAEMFYKICDDVVEGAFSKIQINHKYEIYLKREDQKRQNDLKVIQTHAKFIKGVKDYFKEFGKPRITLDELEENFYINLTEQRDFLWKTATSNFVYRFLLRNKTEGKVDIDLVDCLKNLEKKEGFEYFRASDILHNYETQSDLIPLFRKILEDYYYSNIQTFDFVNCKSEEVQFKDKDVGYVIGKIFKKLKPETDDKYLFELVWLDASGIRGFETAELNKRETISQIILERLSASQLIRFKKKVMDNIQSGIKHSLVLGTHLELCRKLQIVEAKDFVYDTLQVKSYQKYFGHDFADLYMDLGGDLANLLALLETLDDCNTYFFSHLVYLLYIKYSDDVKEILLRFFYADAMKDRKTEYTKILCELGSLEVFKYMISEIVETAKSPYTTQGNYKITRLNTDEALSEIRKIQKFILERDDDSNVRFFETAGGIALEWLYSLAEKSEADLVKVIDFFESAKKELKHYKNVDHFNWYINRVIENFRESDRGGKSISEIILILNQGIC